MFTGLVQEIGHLRTIDKKGNFQRLQVEATSIMEFLSIGDSVAINGVCQTIVDLGQDRFSVECVAETLARTTLSTVEIGQPVNLEPALRLSDRLGGHFVQGHIDDVGYLQTITEKNNEWSIHVSAPLPLLRYIATKGSIAIDGISLTVAYVNSEGFTVSVIPHTFNNTVMRYRKVGDSVNLEVDLIARYLDQLVSKANRPDSKLTLENLRQIGY